MKKVCSAMEKIRPLRRKNFRNGKKLSAIENYRPQWEKKLALWRNISHDKDSGRFLKS